MELPYLQSLQCNIRIPMVQLMLVQDKDVPVPSLIISTLSLFIYFLIYKVLCYITYITQMIANNSICNSSYWTKITTQVKEFLTTLMMMSKTVTVAFFKCAEWQKQTGGTLVWLSLKLEIPTVCHCACLIMAYFFLYSIQLSRYSIWRFMKVAFCLHPLLQECFRCKKYIFQALLLPFQYGTRKNNDWNSQETWVSLASKGNLIKMYKITTQPVI